MSVRISRGTLRKAQAIEDDDNLPAGENGAAANPTDTLRLHTLSVPSTRLSNNSGGSFEEEDSYNKVAQFLGNATHAIAHATFAGHQTLANPLPLPVNANTINEAAISFYLQQQQQQQQQQIKPETLTADNILNWTNNELMKNQLFSFAKQQSTTLSSLGLPSFSHSVDITTPHSLDDMRSVTGNVSGLQPPPVMLDRKPASFDMSKFADSRNVHSTESQASTSSDSTLRDMPRKSFIQEDIRLGKGRFQLVRKRGRSDVWNLFGQVMDTMTNQRLPYVACYACKVLYTDTGGGTGNMTRHRCPLGASYRSITSSSTDTMGESFNNQSSFESFHGASPDTEKIGFCTSYFGF
uniref:BED-type domain-containing protein n=1 Tax=Panagrellus redivivus TaxID=6233 RepID=A0A7E4W5T8_PANRE